MRDQERYLAIDKDNISHKETSNSACPCPRLDCPSEEFHDFGLTINEVLYPHSFHC